MSMGREQFFRKLYLMVSKYLIKLCKKKRPWIMYRKMQMQKTGKEIVKSMRNLVLDCFANMTEFSFHLKKTTWTLKTMRYGYSL